MKTSEIYRKSTDLQGYLFRYGVTGTFVFMSLLLLAIVFILLLHGLPVLSWEFFTEAPKKNMTAGGIGPAIFGTLSVTLLMSVFVLPLGICSAIYLSEYAKDTVWTRIIRASINNLAGVPSIVFGLFGVGFFVAFIGKQMDRLLGLEMVLGKPALVWAAATLAVLVLPIVIVTTSEALRAIPQSQRDASIGLGATKWQTIKSVILPQARPGILTGIILAVSRGMGETAPILFLGCAFYLPHLPITEISLGSAYYLPMINPADQFMNLAYHIFILSTQSSHPTLTLPLQYASTLVLILLTLTLNLTAIILRYRFRKAIGR